MKAISELLEVLVNKIKVPKDDIAIITLYRGQESLLKNELPGSKSLKVCDNSHNLHICFRRRSLPDTLMSTVAVLVK